MTSTRARLLAWGGGRRHSDDAVSPPPRPWRGGNLISARPARVELGGSGGATAATPHRKTASRHSHFFSLTPGADCSPSPSSPSPW